MDPYCAGQGEAEGVCDPAGQEPQDRFRTRYFLSAISPPLIYIFDVEEGLRGRSLAQARPQRYRRKDSLYCLGLADGMGLADGTGTVRCAEKKP